MDFYKAYYHILKHSGVPKEIVKKEADRTLNWCEKNQCRILFPKDYPLHLKAVLPLPHCLFFKGNLSCLDSPQLAVVGSRKASPYAIANSFRFSRELSSLGFTIVSGLALGVDGASHQGALKASGKTLAVMGSGFSHLYPRTHKWLAAEILNREGAWISEYSPYTPPLPHHFPQRNRIISGLSLGTLVVEAHEKSGSLITALWSLEQGREVFVLPGPIDENRFLGAHRLIQEGAKLVTCVRDIVEEVMPSLLPEKLKPLEPFAEPFSFGEKFSLSDWVERNGCQSSRELQLALKDGRMLELEPQRYVWVAPPSS